MKTLKTLLIIIFSSAVLFAHNDKKTFEWNGYGQFQLYKINNYSQGFMVRRTKFWVKGNVPKVGSLSYKVMGIFKYDKTGYFGLLDAYGSYSFNIGYLRFGQQIPEFSLQRLQPDWEIPVIERASVIDRMIPAAQSSARDIGIQAHLNLFTNNWQITAGIFNGNGANIKNHNSSNFLYNVRSTYKIDLGDNYYWHIGGSVMYRKAEQSDFSLIFGSNNLYSGDDFRYGVETLIKLNNLEIQAEYINAEFEGLNSHGYYAYANYKITNKDQLVLSTEQLIDLNKNTNNDPWLNLGYNHLFADHDLKLMVSGGTQFNNNYSLTTQIQIFFN